MSGTVFKFPSIFAFVVQQSRIVVPLVEIFKDRGQNLWSLFRYAQSFCMRIKEVISASSLKVRRAAQDVLVGSEESLVRPDDKRDDVGGKVAIDQCQPNAASQC